MPQIVSPLTRILQICVMVYVAVAVAYTTKFFVDSSYTSGPCYLPSIVAWILRRHDLRSGTNTQRDSDLPRQIMRWTSSESHLLDNLHSAGTPQIAMGEETFFSKTFSRGMRPSKAISYYYRANGNFDTEDITITPLTTSDRFHVFAQLVERYQGLF